MVHDVETLLKQRDQLQAELALADAAATEANEVIECLQDQLAEVQGSSTAAGAVNVTCYTENNGDVPRCLTNQQQYMWQ
jgi:hypothetical protein